MLRGRDPELSIRVWSLPVEFPQPEEEGEEDEEEEGGRLGLGVGGCRSVLGGG